MCVVDATATKMPLVVGRKWVAAKATAVKVEAGIEATGRIAGTVVITKIVMMIAWSDKEMHTDAAKVDHAGRTIAIIDIPVTMMSNVDRGK